MTTSNSEAAGRPARGKNQQNAGRSKAGERQAGPTQSGQVGVPGKDRYGRARRPSKTSAASVPAGWGRYLVAARPAPMVPAGVAVLDPGQLSQLLSEDENVIMLGELGQGAARPETEQVDGAGPADAGPAGSADPANWAAAQLPLQQHALHSEHSGLPGHAGHAGHGEHSGHAGHSPLDQHPIHPPRPACPAVNVVAMPPARAAQLAADPALICEIDASLVCTPANPLSAIVPAADPALAVPLISPETLVVHVRDRDGAPVPGAHVWALGTAFPAHALTDSSGTAIVVLVADTPETLRGIYVRPAAGFWPARVPAGQALGFDGDDVTVTVRSLSEPHAGFATPALAGWGAAALGTDRLPADFRGDGVRIAVLDSGIDASHPMLKEAVRGGGDFTGADSDPQAWAVDRTGQGTGCAGVIAAADTGSGQGGIATEAELYGLRLFPHGRVVDLLAALDWCVENAIDVAQINVVCPPSALVEWKLADAAAAGVVVIAPAGDTGTITAFPAAAPGVIAVGALAHPDTDPDTHLDGPPARPVWPGPFTPAFTPIGADVAAPGTAIVTTAPGGEHTVADGTAIAASHITALAALLIAHHEQLRGPGAGPGEERRRSGGRTEQVAALLHAASRIPPGCDPDRAGAGLPDAATAFAVGVGVGVGPAGQLGQLGPVGQLGQLGQLGQASRFGSIGQAGQLGARMA